MIRLLLLLLMLALAGPVRAESWAITGARLWTGTSDVPLENATILIRDGVVQSIETGGALPAGVRTVAAAGRVVTPALVAGATQIGLVELASAPEADDRRITSGPLGAAFEAARGVDANALTIVQARADGIGHALVFPGAPAQGVIDGYAAWLDLAERVEPVERTRAGLFAVAGIQADALSGGNRGAVWTLLRAALDEARRLRRGAAGSDLDPIERANYEALAPVLDGEAPLAIAAHREADIRQALDLAREYRLRLVIVGGAEAWRVADRLAAERVPVVLDPLEALPVSLDVVGARRDNAALLAAAGVEIAFFVSGQGIYLSHNVGPAIRTGAGIAVANGLPYAAGLRALTSAPARIWGDSEAGVLAPGHRADLVIWDGDPLEPSSAPERLVLAGREVPLVTRQTLLRDRYAPAALGSERPR